MINRYLLWRFDCLGAIAVAITTLLALVGGASPGLAALAITSAQSLVQSVYWLCRFISALEVDLNAVERVTELLNTPQEPPMIVEGKRPPAYWPSDTGGISVEDLVISYAPTLPPVIKGVSFEIAPREKVGVVGRTGSGKSTMALSLLRFTDPTSGRIM
jgi:ABC-type multidrug transport system fused ATPase/permease subunit